MARTTLSRVDLAPTGPPLPWPTTENAHVQFLPGSVFPRRRRYALLRLGCGGEAALVVRQMEVVGRVGNDVLLRGELSEGERLVTTQSVAIAPGLRVEFR